MTASEFAFLALGLVLGVAGGSAIVAVLGSRPPSREVRLTVERGAIPRRPATLSSDAFLAPGEPARGGPADRRRLDRDAPVPDPPPPSPHRAFGSSGGPDIRTTVPSWPARVANSMRDPALTAGDRPVSGAISVQSERDPSIDALRIQAVLAAERAQQAGQMTATALLEPRPMPEPATAEAPDPGESQETTPAIIRILRGDRRALLRTVEVLAGADRAMRRPWQAAIIGLAEALVGRAIDRGVLDFPVGNPFWDTFTTEQCRTIASALAAAGFRFDGVDGWADERLPGYRDLTAAVALAGLEPRRIRAWPTQEEIAALYGDVTVAADELLLDTAPELDLADVRELAGQRAAELGDLWRSWEIIRPVLAAPVLAAPVA